ncbi:MAG TPA: hypothetical protein VMW36_08505 [Patescibacteria group bacterium]|nr:hypothetical protein [Patescibacteria group bacterium]
MEAIHINTVEQLIEVFGQPNVPDHFDLTLYDYRMPTTDENFEGIVIGWITEHNTRPTVDWKKNGF